MPENLNGKLKEKKQNLCCVCKNRFSPAQTVPVATVRDSLLNFILRKNPDLNVELDFICLNDLNKVRKEYFQQLIKEEKGDLTEVEIAVVDALQEHEVVSKHIDHLEIPDITFGELLSDRIARFGGSWTFIMLFATSIAIWVVWNSSTEVRFDPYPYILLNLFLSCLASLQAPIIMMSQNRQQVHDRLNQEQDYKVNLKSEVEIRVLNEKIDKLISHQWQRLLEIQEMQMDFMEQLTDRKHK
ncbi:MAG: DUF1003 domain-containing protein [Bacteriovorax sp.]|jgi:uncharacterized membrane protein